MLVESRFATESIPSKKQLDLSLQFFHRSLLSSLLFFHLSLLSSLFFFLFGLESLHFFRLSFSFLLHSCYGGPEFLDLGRRTRCPPATPLLWVPPIPYPQTADDRPSNKSYQYIFRLNISCCHAFNRKCPNFYMMK